MQAMKRRGTDITLLGRTQWPSPGKATAYKQGWQSSEAFDLSRPALKDPLCAALDVDKNVSIERNPGIDGAMNEGTWIVRGRGGRGDLVLKMVPGFRRRIGELTEAESFMKLDREHPTLASDASLAFPIKILALGRAKDLIVMKKAPGEALALLMARKKRSGQETSLMRIFERIGESVGAFHKRYGGKQHGDLHGSNIFYDEASRRVTLIDLRDMGNKNRMTDVEYFTYSVRLVAKTYPCAEEYLRHFQIGYANGRNGHLEALDRRFEPLQRLRIAMGLHDGGELDEEEEGEEEEQELYEDEEGEEAVALLDEDTEWEIEKEHPGLLPVIVRPLIRWTQLDVFGACICNSEVRSEEAAAREETEDSHGEILVQPRRFFMGI